MKKNRFLVTLVSVLLGLFVGGIILLIGGFDPIETYKVMILGVFSKPKYMAWTIIRSTPIILTGISVAFAFRTGLFNIGAEGQFIIGSIFATMAGVFLDLPPFIHVIVAILIGALAAGIWGGIIGILKSKFGVHEVISSIMMNWIALYLNNYFLTFSSFRKPNSDSSFKIMDSASTKILGNWKLSEVGKAFLNKHEIIKGILNPPLNYGIFIAILVAIAAYYTLKNTTLGYQLKAVGYNREAAEYAGININKNVILSLFIAGAISGIAGATQVLGVEGQVGILAASQGYGFDGIGVSLIAANNPLAAIPAGLLFGGLKYGGGKLNSLISVPSEIIDITIGTIIFFVSMPKLIDIMGKVFKKKKRGDQVE